MRNKPIQWFPAVAYLSSLMPVINKIDLPSADPERVKAEIEDLAGQYNMPVEQVEKLLPVDMLKHDIAMKKAVEVIATTAKVK